MRIEGQGMLAAVVVVSSVGLGIVLAPPVGRGIGGLTAAGDLERGVVAVMFWSWTCPSCERMKPAWDSIEASPPPGVRAVDVPLIPGETDRTFSEYGVTETPTFLVLREGAVVGRLVGEVGGDPEAVLREWIEESVGSAEAESAAGPASAPLYLLPALGALMALSPCSAPLVAAYATVGGGRRARDYILCAASSFLGTAALAALLGLASSAAIGVMGGVRRAMASAAVLFGSIAAFSASDSCPIPGRRIRSILSSSLPAACFGFGLVAAQCGLPLLAGYVALVGAAGDPATGVAGAVLLAAGMSAALAASLYLIGRVGVLGGPISSSKWFERSAGAILAALGIYLMLE